MKPVRFDSMMNRVIHEYETKKSIYGVNNFIYYQDKKQSEIFQNTIENRFGVAAGPHTQLAVNIVAAYVAGSRFFELKTVQIIDGEELHIDKPCILAHDEGYNVEWSSELYVPQACDEYIKAWYACKLLAKEYGFGDPNGFIFNMSVGYSLEGIQSKKIDDFIETLKDASTASIWKECEQYALQHLSDFKNIDETFIRSIKPQVCNSITLSTMHGCPASDIEAIATYLLQEKNLHTYLKCNPTLLGYDFTRQIMDEMGYNYMAFDEHHFNTDLQFDEAVAMIHRLQETAKQVNREFGVKLSNTFPVSIKNQELPGQEMYMSGKSLYPLTINLANKLAQAFQGKLSISYSGGADLKNIEKIAQCGIWPITVATVLLKPTGYQKIKQLVLKMDDIYQTQMDLNLLSELAESVRKDPAYMKQAIKLPQAHQSLQTLDCKVVCSSCVNVCPNRANLVLKCAEKKILLHLDDVCNECGNCFTFCVDACYPYKDRLTLFSSKEMLLDSENQGFYYTKTGLGYRYLNEVNEGTIEAAPSFIQEVSKVLMSEYPSLGE